MKLSLDFLWWHLPDPFHSLAIQVRWKHLIFSCLLVQFTFWSNCLGLHLLASDLHRRLLHRNVHHCLVFALKRVGYSLDQRYHQRYFNHSPGSTKSNDARIRSHAGVPLASCPMNYTEDLFCYHARLYWKYERHGQLLEESVSLHLSQKKEDYLWQR